MSEVLRVGAAAIPYTIVRSKRKTLGIEVDQNGEVIARIPYRGVALDEARRFVEEKKDWIIKNQIKMEDRRKRVLRNNWSEKKPITYPWIRTQGGKLFENKVKSWAGVMGVEYNRITIKDVESRWGSCSSKRNINFCWKLFTMPERLVDYIIVHELAHIRHMNHSREFWAEVEKYIPDYKQRKRDINNYV